MVPAYNALYRPLLEALSDKAVHQKKEIVGLIAKKLHLSEEDITERLSTGTPALPNRVAWACTYLKKAGLIESPARSKYQITAEGISVLASGRTIDNAYLCSYPSFADFVKRAKAATDPAAAHQQPASSPETTTPIEMIEQAVSTMNQELADNLMSEIIAQDPSFFEHLVVKLLCKMGYGGSSADSGVVTQKSNDGGIDGIIREDKLGFDQIYIQAKRWDTQTTISRPEIQKFYGALAGFGASKGLFITTAKFSDAAKDYANQQHIVLVDGDRLTKLMIEYNLGVAPVAKYEIKALDTDFFNEDSDF